ASAAPQHGFARTAPWRLERVETAGGESLTLTLSLSDGDVVSPFWPEPFRVIYTVTFAQTLSLRLAMQNRATHPIIFEEALHTYFAISDIKDIAISGLAGTTYIDKTDAARRKLQPAALVTITAETDSVYLDTSGRCIIEDRGWRRRIIIEKNGAASSVVWNPWAEKAAAMVDLGDPAWRGMVCVEAGNIADNEVRLAADTEHVMSTAISVDARSWRLGRLTDGDRSATLAIDAVEDLRGVARRRGRGSGRSRQWRSRLAGIDWKLAAAEARLASLDRKLARLIWAIVINAAATMTMLVK